MLAPPRPATLAAALLALTLLDAGCFASRRVHPRSAEELRRGYAFVAEGDLERAETAFSHALEFDPDLVEARNGLGVVARTRGDLTTALRWFSDALALDDAFSEAHANKGEALLASERLAAAEESLRAALKLNPDLVEARHNLGRALLRRGLAEPDHRAIHWARARETYLHVLETDERRPGAHGELALLAYLSGDLARAEAHWSRAAALESGDREAAHGLCLVRTAQGRCREAILECRRCLSLSPGYARCEQSLATAEECAE